MNSSYDYCVVGAGPSGLTAAYQLLKAGHSVILLERDSRIGGLAKSYNYDGHVFDTGPKRFHTEDPIVLDFIKEIIQDSVLQISRSTEVYFLKKYFEWPLKTRELFKMPWPVIGRCAVDLIKAKKIQDPHSFREFIISKYGPTLYEIFFAPYTGKFLRWDPKDIHSDWASTGINRTVIDKRIKTNTLLDILKVLVLPEKVDTHFLYPMQGGFGGFYERLLARCQEYPQFSLLLNNSVGQLTKEEESLGIRTKDGKSISCTHLIWSGNLNYLANLIASQQNVHYLNTIFYNLICRQEGISHQRSQWIYVSRGDSLISRITCMKEFAPYTCKNGYYNVICELTDSQAKPFYFLNPERYKDKILEELKGMAFLKDSRFVEGVQINPVVDTYPVYHRHYTRDFASIAGQVKKFSPRIHLLGRCGAFWYNNSDHSIRFAIELTHKLLGKKEQEFAYRDYFGGTSLRAAHPQGE